MNCCGPASAAQLDAVVDDNTRSLSESSGIPSDLEKIPVYQQYISGEASFQRVFIHLKGIRGVQKRKNRFGGVRWFDAVADPYCIATATGAAMPAEYFNVHTHTFPVIQNSSVWDAKSVVLCKEMQKLEFVVMDKNRGTDQVLMKATLTEFPDAVSETIESPGEWTEYIIKPDNTVDEEEAMELVVSLKITTDWLVSPQTTAALRQSNEQVQYSEHILSATDKTPDDNALLQCWKKQDSKSAVLWILGRNDCFMHPHVTETLFENYDIYVLNYSMNGACRQQGWVADAHLNSHNKYGDFNSYCDQIAEAVTYLEDYETVLGYAHSTGGPVLLNYLMERGDDDVFDGFLFNSPFLDWGFVGGDIVELVLEHTGILDKMGLLSLDNTVGAAETPDELKETPLRYLNREVVLSPWSAKLWSQYHFDWACRPLYQVPMTGGFAKGVTAVHDKLKNWHDQSKPVTTKPFLCITSRGDDVLKAAETTSRADWIGPNRWECELNDNGHDVFLSTDVNDTLLALDMCKVWMKSRRLL